MWYNKCMKNFTHVHSSSRFDRSVGSLEKAIETYIEEGSLVTFTEVAFPWRERALVEVPRWGYILGDKSMRDDCGIIYDKTVWRKVSGYTKVVLQPMFWKANGEKVEPTGAAFAVLEHKETGNRLLVTVCHLPAGVEGPSGLAGLPNRVAAWREAHRNWNKEWNRLAKEQHVDAILVTADWNLNIKRKVLLPLFKAIHPGMTLVFKYKHIPAGGTHGKRWIDFSFIRGKLKVVKYPQLLKDDASSDHRPFAETYGWI